MRMLERYQEDICTASGVLEEERGGITACDITDIAHWFAMDPRQDWSAEDYPKTVSPFPLAWYDWKAPAHMRFGDRTVSMRSSREAGQIEYQGCMTRTAPCPEGGYSNDVLSAWVAETFPSGLRLFCERSEVDVSPRRLRAARQEKATRGVEAGFLQQYWFFFQIRGRGVLPVFWHAHYLAPDGAPLGFANYLPEQDLTLEDIPSAAMGMGAFLSGQSGDVGELTATTQWLQPVYIANSFFHASNVDVQERKTPAKVRRKRAEKGVPSYDYRRIKVDAIRSRVRRLRGESSEETELEQALSFVRGHFKKFTAENPLFGKHEGTYWWGMHARGKEERGKVEKEYEVGAPSSGASPRSGASEDSPSEDSPSEDSPSEDSPAEEATPHEEKG